MSSQPLMLLRFPVLVSFIPFPWCKRRCLLFSGCFQQSAMSLLWYTQISLSDFFFELRMAMIAEFDHGMLCPRCDPDSGMRAVSQSGLYRHSSRRPPQRSNFFGQHHWSSSCWDKSTFGIVYRSWNSCTDDDSRRIEMVAITSPSRLILGPTNQVTLIIWQPWFKTLNRKGSEDIIRRSLFQWTVRIRFIRASLIWLSPFFDHWASYLNRNRSGTSSIEVSFFFTLSFTSELSGDKRPSCVGSPPSQKCSSRLS